MERFEIRSILISCFHVFKRIALSYDHKVAQMSSQDLDLSVSQAFLDLISDSDSEDPNLTFSVVSDFIEKIEFQALKTSPSSEDPNNSFDLLAH